VPVAGMGRIVIARPAATVPPASTAARAPPQGETTAATARVPAGVDRFVITRPAATNLKINVDRDRMAHASLTEVATIARVPLAGPATKAAPVAPPVSIPKGDSALAKTAPLVNFPPEKTANRQIPSARRAMLENMPKKQGLRSAIRVKRASILSAESHLVHNVLPATIPTAQIPCPASSALLVRFRQSRKGLRNANRALPGSTLLRETAPVVMTVRLVPYLEQGKENAATVPLASFLGKKVASVTAVKLGGSPRLAAKKSAYRARTVSALQRTVRRALPVN
jgi:hypothetical protein